MVSIYGKQLLAIIATLVAASTCWAGPTATSGAITTESRAIISSRWPRTLQEYMRRESVYGDRRIEKGEVEYLSRVLFKKGDVLGPDKENSLRSLGTVCKLYGADVSIIDLFVAEIANRTGWQKDDVRHILTEAASSLFQLEVKGICETIVAKEGHVAVTESRLLSDIPGQMLRTADISPEIYATFALENAGALEFAIDWLRVQQSPDKYATSLAERLLNSAMLTRDVLLPMDLCQYMSYDSCSKLIDMARSKVPHRVNEKGETEYTAEMLGGVTDSLLRLTMVAAEHMRAVAEYRMAKADPKSLQEYFFTATTGVGITDRAWLLYRHHSNLVLPVLEQYGKMTDVALDAQIRWVLTKFLEHVVILDSYVADWNKAKAAIRTMAFEGGNSVQKVNGLLVLEKVSAEDDLERLIQLAHDETKVTWKSGERTYTEPLIAYRSVGCIYTIGTTKSREVLENIAKDSKIDPKVRASAENLLKRQGAQSQRLKH